MQRESAFCRTILFMLSCTAVSALNVTAQQTDSIGQAFGAAHSTADTTVESTADPILKTNDTDALVSDTAAAGPDRDTASASSGYSDTTDGFSDESEEAAGAGVERMPELASFVEAQYPDSLLKRGVAGDVLLDVLVDDSGMVDSVAVVAGLHPALDSAAKEAVGRFRFTPAIAEGDSVAVILQYRYTFSIQQQLETLEQYVNYKGVVKAMGTREPVQDAMVVITFPDSACSRSVDVPFDAYLDKIGSFEGQYREQQGVVAITDSTGAFSFTSLPACKIGVRIVAPGYNSFKTRQRIDADSQTVVTYRVEKRSYSPYEVVVYGKEKKTEVAKRTITMSEVKKVPGFGGDAVKVVQAMPGVGRAFFGSGQIIVRGNSTMDNQYFLNGTYTPYLFHFGGGKSVYNSDALEAVDFYPGGFGARYGNAIGGVVELTGRDAKEDRWHGIVDVSLLDAAMLFEGPVNEKLSVLVTARRSYIADMLKYAIEVGGFKLPFTVTPYYWDYVLRADYRPDDKHHVYASFVGVKDRLEMFTDMVRGGSVEIDENTDEFDIENRFHTQGFGWEWKIHDALTNSFDGGVCEYTEGSSAFGFFTYDLEGTPYNFRNELTYEPSARLKYTFGLDVLVASLQYTMATIDARNEIQKDSTEFLLGPYAGYFQLEWRGFDERLQLIPGIRYDYYPQLRHNGTIIPEFWDYELDDPLYSTRFPADPSLRITGRYEYRDGHTIKAALGSYNQEPQPIGRAIHQTWGNPDMETTKARHVVGGYEWQMTDLISVDIQAYANRIWDLARSPSQKEYARNPQLEPFIDNGKGRIKGLELFIRHDQGQRFFGWISYTLSHSERYSYQHEEWRVYGLDITNHLQIVGSWQFPHHLEAGFRYRFVGGYPTTPRTGVDYYDASSFNYEPVLGKENSARMAPYMGLDVRVERTFAFSTWMCIAYLDAQNLFHILRFFDNAQGEPVYAPPELSSYNYNYDFSEKNVMSDIPRAALGIRVEF